jgi:SAM-dependent methyltransferase
MPERNKTNTAPRLYRDLAKWFHLLTAPEDYKGEASFYSKNIKETSRISVIHVLEMGSGGGNNAFYMKADFKLTLTDLSKDMLAISRNLNPECEHIQGDMRNLRLGCQFDAVFVHDAVSYITKEKDLKAVFETAFIHCKSGGAVLFCPDYIKETFQEVTSHGGHSKGSRGLRYISWTWDPDPLDTSYVVDFAYLLKEGDTTTCEYDRHTLGVFSRDAWFRLLNDAGFKDVKTIPHPEADNWTTPVFTGVKPK